jgi:hypothetical protein
MTSARVQIPLRNKNKEIVAYATVDAIDADRVLALKWYLHNGYANSTYVDNGIKKHVSMHRFIMQATPDQGPVDHRDCHRLNNWRDNLRFVTASMNLQNRLKKAGCKSVYIGVSSDNSKGKSNPWSVHCGSRCVGYYSSELEAAYAYNLAALDQFGQDARINDVQKPDDFQLWTKRELKSKNVFVDGQELVGLSYVSRKRGMRYQINLRINGKCHKSTYRDLEKAKIAYFDFKKPQTKVDIIIPRSPNGTALLPCTGTSGGVLVDDDTYLKFAGSKICCRQQNLPLFSRRIPMSESWRRKQVIAQTSYERKRWTNY